MKSSTTTMLFARKGKVLLIFELDNSTYIIKKSLQELADEFYEQYKEKLESSAIFSEDYDDFPELLHKYFPFLD